jgi:chromosome segregation ATPase
MKREINEKDKLLDEREREIERLRQDLNEMNTSLQKEFNTHHKRREEVIEEMNEEINRLRRELMES